MIPTTFLTFASLLVGALATPIANPVATDPGAVVVGSGRLIDERGEIVKRVEGVHLLNCGDSKNLNRYSVVVYCPNDSNCHYAPSQSNSCRFNSGVIWEGGHYSCQFSTGVRFTWWIEKDAQSKPNWSHVGNGNNGYKSFAIRKDDKHAFYTDAQGYVCRTIYYSLPN
ncbi:hypothetical protein QBC44DRAFT_46097 [Cladorrhinum sp. PSN332]|nr:hypothetical protein QBC44DRAFT_46097 [Cladorrhinum sp. PSN332]